MKNSIAHHTPISEHSTIEQTRLTTLTTLASMTQQVTFPISLRFGDTSMLSPNLILLRHKEKNSDDPHTPISSEILLLLTNPKLEVMKTLRTKMKLTYLTRVTN